MTARLLLGADRERAAQTIRARHYTHSVPSGKNYYVAFDDAIVVWAIPANPYIAMSLFGRPGRVWELSRLWAPDGHAPNLLTQAISAAVGVLRQHEKPDVLVSYADPNMGHDGAIYRAASWTSHGQCAEVRAWRARDGKVVARRAFHSGSRSLRKAEIEALGYRQLTLPGKLRFVKPCSKSAAKWLTEAAEKRAPAKRMRRPHNWTRSRRRLKARRGMTCSVCKVSLWSRRSDARTCSVRCRVRAHRGGSVAVTSKLRKAS